MKLLLLSNSTIPGQAYLEWPKDLITDFLGEINTAIFIPYAAVSFSYEDYEEMVMKALEPVGIHVKSLHHAKDPISAIEGAEAILVGGGNTFHLLSELYRLGLVVPIQSKVRSGMPYIGWSAGSNVACPSIKTTNDMPIVNPPSFDGLDLSRWQINPHYTEKTIEGHGGESRKQRLLEYAAVNDIPVLCLPEGTALRVKDDTEEIISESNVKLIHPGGDVEILSPGEIQ